MAMAGDGMFRGVTLMESCIHCGDTAVERRPYHKYCSCALHKNGGGGRGSANNSCSHPSRTNLISYPMRRSWSEGSLALAGGASGYASPPCGGSAAASPALGSGLKRTLTQESLVSYAELF